jgi:hypothetical protein
VSIGLPVTCSVVPPNSVNLDLWLDSSDKGTITIQNENEIMSWIDKSGKSLNFNLSSGSPAIIKKNSINDRNSIHFNDTAETSYSLTDPLTNFPQNQSFRLAIVLKVNDLDASNFEFDTAGGPNIRVQPGGGLVYSVGGLDSDTNLHTFLEGAVIKLILSYSFDTNIFSIQDGVNEIGSFSLSSMPAWTGLTFKASGDIEISELNLYKELIPLTDLEAYLNKKWGF